MQSLFFMTHMTSLFSSFGFFVRDNRISDWACMWVPGSDTIIAHEEPHLPPVVSSEI